MTRNIIVLNRKSSHERLRLYTDGHDSLLKQFETHTDIPFTSRKRGSKGSAGSLFIGRYSITKSGENRWFYPSKSHLVGLTALQRDLIRYGGGLLRRCAYQRNFRDDIFVCLRTSEKKFARRELAGTL